MIRYFYDFEFIEDGRTIEPVSLGIAADDGRTYYAVNGNVHWERLGHPQWSWLRTNVWKHLPTTGPGQLSLNRHHPDVKDRTVIAQEVRDFLLYGETPDGQLPEIELWGDYPAYDHVALCQLWGRMVNLPEGIPMRTNCIVQYAQALGISEKRLPQMDFEMQHHALYDAKHSLKVFASIHPEPFRQRHILSGATGVQIGDGNVQSNTFAGPRRGEEGNPSVSFVTRGKTYGGRPVRDLPPLPSEG